MGGSLPAGPAADCSAAAHGDAARQGLRLLCRGIVQGVGFRPAVHGLAASLGLDGVLSNIGGAVQLELIGPRLALQAFCERLPSVLRPPARLDALEVHGLPWPLPAELAAVRGLRITAAAPTALGEGWSAPSLVADLAPCPDCLAELHDPTSRRHRYPFLSCSRCGPRYSIATAEPWCRAHTTLASFPLCPACRREFEDPADRRFHAETIACPACGPRLQLQHLVPGRSPGRRSGASSLSHFAADGPVADAQVAGVLVADGPVADTPVADAQVAEADPLESAAALLRSGGILALQGVGGFQLLVDAGDAAAVARLRRRKGRGGKPFALLVLDPSWLAALVRINPTEDRLLRHPSAPIVLLRRRAQACGALPGVAPGAPALG